MSLSGDVPSFCLFCYKSISSITKTKEGSFKIKQFSKFLSRFVCSESIHNQFVDTINTNYGYGLLNCCEGCEISVNRFCEIYNQIKYLELQLDAKLDKIVKKIELSNKIPSRWMNVKTALQLTFQDDVEKISECRTDIIGMRQNVIKSGFLRSSQSQPRVLVERLDQAVINSIVYQPTIHEDKFLNSPENTDNIEEDEIWNKEVTHSVQNDLQIEIKQEYPQSLFSENDDEIPEESVTSSPPPLPKSNANRGATYVTCEICGKKVAALLKNKHHRMAHDLSKVAHEYQIFRCSANDCTAYFLSKRQLKDHNSEMHTTNKKILNEPSAEYLDGVKYFRCEICKTPFDNLKSYKGHISSTKCGIENEEISPKRNVECAECREIFETKNDLWTHQFKAHTTEKRMFCPKCGKFFREKRRFEAHMEYHKGQPEWKWECKECGKRSATVYQLRRHISIHRKADANLVEDDLIIEHKENDAMEEDETLEDALEIEEDYEQSSIKVSPTSRRRVCTQCGKRFGDEMYLRMHMMRVHKKRAREMNWQCGKCGKKFVNKWNMTSHMKFHEENKLLNNKNIKKLGSRKTDSIAKRTTPKSNLSKDPLEMDIKKELTGDVQCLECDELLENEKELWIHQNEVHLKNVCKLCGKEFVLKPGLKLHMIYHEDPQDWKWECKECGKKCATKQKLREHLRIHTGIKPYACHLCEKRCGLPQNLRRHLKEQHGVTVVPQPKIRKEKNKGTVTCPYCETKLAHKASLKRHCKFVHKEITEEKFETDYNEINSFNVAKKGNSEHPMDILP